MEPTVTTLIIDQDAIDTINTASIASANATTAKDSSTVTLSIPTAARALQDTYAGYLDLSAVNEGWITIQRDGSFKDTPKLTAIIEALDARALARRAELKAEGLDIQLDPPSNAYHAIAMSHSFLDVQLEALAEMLRCASVGQFVSLTDAIEEQMEATSDELVATVKAIENLLAAECILAS